MTTRGRAASGARATRRQVDLTRQVTAWYLESYFRTPHDVGVATMFCSTEHVGHFAVEPDALAAGDPEALFRLLVTVTMFQRRSDQMIMRVLRSLSREQAAELSTARPLLLLADELDCPGTKSLEALHQRCDLAKDADTRLGTCGYRPDLDCHLKRHTVELRRYGHFGKVPTSAALSLRAQGVSSLAELHQRICRDTDDPHERALRLEASLSRAWRVSDKIAAMYLSLVTNRELSGRLAPWADGVDSTHFVVIDSNVDLFLRALGYRGAKTYAARRAFVHALARAVDLSELDARLNPYNPRIVQQAAYMFMSDSNRRASSSDCSKGAPGTCARCPDVLHRQCRLRWNSPRSL
jgi:hypothetical protein